MPRISKYYGIAVYRYFQAHAPPHFHAIYGEDEAVIGITKGKPLEGSLPKRALKLVAERTKQHQKELLENWARAHRGEPLVPIAPLD